ncbi:MAG: penicillin acylase family protein [Ignavibacteria bacterium]|nr:MAG: penicillin acylase family protein [Ignavibacteria bacterium]
MANDTHLALSLPDKWVFVVNIIEGKTLAGFTLPGLPVTVIGTNKKIAWGLTNLMADQCDFISVKNDAIKQYDIVEDTIRVKNDLPVGFKIFNTKIGPVINNRHLLDFLYGKSKVNKAIALKWTAAENHGELKAFINLNKAGNWSEFKSALKDFGSPAQNFLYADIDGNIGWHAAGAIPKRKNPGQILYGNEFAGWNGFINFDKLPSEFNPSKGFIASANNKPDKLNYYITNFWEPEERFVRAEELLTITPESDTKFLMNMQKDITSSYPKEFVEEILNAFSNVKIKDENLKVALDLLKEWDYTYSKYSQTPSIFEAFFNSLLKNTLADELGDTVLKKLSFISNVPLLVMKQLLRKNSVLWDNVKTAEIKESRYSIIRKSLVDAIYSLETEYGKDPAMWQWGRLHKITLKHPFHGVAELIDNNFDLGPHQLNGGHTTLYNTGYSFNEPYDANLGSAMRMIYDFSTPNQIYIIQPAGISGHPGSEFYNNFTKKWLNGDLIKVNFNEDSFLYSLTIKPY